MQAEVRRKQKTTSKTKSYICRILLLLGVLLLAMGLWYGVQGYQMYRNVLAETPIAEKTAAIEQQESFVPYDALPQIYREMEVFTQFASDLDNATNLCGCSHFRGRPAVFLPFRRRYFGDDTGTVERFANKVVCRGRQYHFPAAGEEPVFHAGENLAAETCRDVPCSRLGAGL